MAPQRIKSSKSRRPTGRSASSEGTVRGQASIKSQRNRSRGSLRPQVEDERRQGSTDEQIQAVTTGTHRGTKSRTRDFPQKMSTSYSPLYFGAWGPARYNMSSTRSFGLVNPQQKGWSPFGGQGADGWAQRRRPAEPWCTCDLPLIIGLCYIICILALVSLSVVLLYGQGSPLNSTTTTRHPYADAPGGADSNHLAPTTVSPQSSFS